MTRDTSQPPRRMRGRREYGTIDTAIWKHPAFKALPDDAKLLCCYLRTCEHGNLIGCYYLPAGYVAADLGWTHERILAALRALEPRRFALWCSVTEHCWLPQFVRRFPIANANQAKHAIRLFEELPSGFTYHADLARSLLQAYAFGETLGKPLRNALPTPAQGLPHPEPEPEPEPEPDLDRTYPDAFERLWSLLPARSGSNPKRRAWHAYQARIKGGHTHQQIEDGARRYATWCSVTGKLHTETVMQAATFLGPDLRFLETWEPPAEAGGDSFIASLQRSGAQGGAA